MTMMPCRACQRPRTQARPISLDDIVALARTVELVIGRHLDPSESSRLKAAWHATRSSSAGDHPLEDLVNELART